MLTPFPADCCALVVEDEPVQALDLACMLAGFGCAVIGPADLAGEALQLLGRRRPSFALFDANLPAGSLVPLADTLAQLEVPFAVLATGLEHALDRLPGLRGRLASSSPSTRGNCIGQRACCTRAICAARSRPRIGGSAKVGCGWPSRFA